MPHTLVTFHAHPDDEAIACGGVMAKYSDAGHRVVLVVATKGEHGEIVPGVLEPGEELWTRRVQETHRSAEILGASRVEFLGYVDSGMMGTPENDKDGSFWSARLDDAAERLAKILAEEQADVLTIYDDNGGYGHPDHIQVHRVGVRAAETVGTAKVYENTINRDHILRGFEFAKEMNVELPGDLNPEDFTLGVTEDRITTTVDVTDYVERKRAAMKAHASQIADTSFFLAMPEEAFVHSFGYEWFMLRGAPPGTSETDLFQGLE